MKNMTQNRTKTYYLSPSLWSDSQLSLNYITLMQKKIVHARM